MGNQDVIILNFNKQLNNLSSDMSLKLRSEFESSLTDMADLIESVYQIKVTNVSQEDLMKKAGEKAKKLKKLRTLVEKRRKFLKEDSLRTGQAIDGIARLIRTNIEDAESYAIEQRDFVKIEEKKRQQERIKVWKKRIAELGEDPDKYGLVYQNEANFEIFYEGLKKRIAEEAAQKEKAEKERIEREKREAELQKELQEKDALLKAEQERRERLEAEAQQRIARECEAKKAAEREARQKELAPDKEKLLQLALDIASIEFPQLENSGLNIILSNVRELLVKVETYIKNKVNAIDDCPF